MSCCGTEGAVESETTARVYVVPQVTVVNLASLDNGRGGVIAQCEFGNDVPKENILAVFEAWSESSKNTQRV